MTNDDQLWAAQQTVAKAFFELEASHDFLLSGGAALVALGLSQRPTEDLDVFTKPPRTTVKDAKDQLEQSAHARGWDVEILLDEERFARLRIMVDGEVVVVDLAIDSAPHGDPVFTILGPTMARDEVAARKLLALFDRAEARDFVDVFHLAQSFNRDDLVRRAMEIDLGFDMEMFNERLRSHTRHADSEFPTLTPQEVRTMRRFFDGWAEGGLSL